MGRTKVVMIVHQEGVVYVPGNMLAGRGDFEAVARLLREAVAERAARPDPA